MHNSILFSCTIDTDECDSIPCHQICRNTPGSYQCRCYDGYEMDGIACIGKYAFMFCIHIITSPLSGKQFVANCTVTVTNYLTDLFLNRYQ